jgi:hypothetical protein
MVQNYTLRRDGKRGRHSRHWTDYSTAGLLSVATIAVAVLVSPCQAASKHRSLDLSIKPMVDIRSESGPIERALGTESGMHRALAAEDRPEIAIQAGSLGVALRREDNKVKPDLFYDVSGWRLRTRIMSDGESPLQIEGMLLRAAHTFPLFGPTHGSADLP